MGPARAVAAAVAALMTMAALLAASAPPEPPVLPIEQGFLAEDECLAPAFEGAGCPKPDTARLPSASAALLAPDLSDPAPLLAFDVSVLREESEVTSPI